MNANALKLAIWKRTLAPYGETVGGSVRSARFFIPAVELRGSLLHYRWTEHQILSQATNQGMLDDFLALSSAQDVLRFAGRYGVLGLCKVHALPACQPQGHEQVAHCAPGSPESVDAWLAYAQSARELLGRAVELHQAGSPKDTDWWELADQINRWLYLGNVVPVCTPATRNPGLDLSLVNGMLLALRASGFTVRPFPNAPAIKMPLISGFQGVFSVIAVQLFSAAAAKDGPALCYACGRIYMPTRRPRGERHYCQNCGRAVAVRVSAREHKRRKRAAELHKQGLSPKGIAEKLSTDLKTIQKWIGQEGEHCRGKQEARTK